MQTKIDIINIALGNLSNTNFIESLEEGNDEARQAALRWDNSVDVILSDFAWSFASRRASLVLLADSPDDEKHFMYPADCIKIRSLHMTDEPRCKPLPFRIGRSVDNKRRVVITACSPVTAVYTTRNVEPGEWPSVFANAVSWYLASEIAIATRADHQLANAMLQSYAYQVGKAKLFDAEERGEAAPPESKWMQSRYV